MGTDIISHDVDAGVAQARAPQAARVHGEVTALEQMLDAAVAARAGSRGRSVSHALARVPDVSALARTVPERLCWKGVVVSEGFQRYAERVARGEALAPYRGPVLARPSSDFPWQLGAPVAALPAAPEDPFRTPRASSREQLLALVAVLVLLFLGGGTLLATASSPSTLDFVWPNGAVNAATPSGWSEADKADLERARNERAASEALAKPASAQVRARRAPARAQPRAAVQPTASAPAPSAAPAVTTTTSSAPKQTKKPTESALFVDTPSF